MWINILSSKLKKFSQFGFDCVRRSGAITTQRMILQLFSMVKIRTVERLLNPLHSQVVLRQHLPLRVKRHEILLTAESHFENYPVREIPPKSS